MCTFVNANLIVIVLFDGKDWEITSKENMRLMKTCSKFSNSKRILIENDRKGYTVDITVCAVLKSLELTWDTQLSLLSLFHFVLSKWRMPLIVCGSQEIDSVFHPYSWYPEPGSNCMNDSGWEFRIQTQDLHWPELETNVQLKII
jgi:hypothetical protein